MRFLIVVILILSSYNLFAAQNEPKILTLVNGKVITSFDVEQRITALNMLGKNLPSDMQIKQYILQTLIDEELYFYETKRLKIYCDDYDIKKYFQSVGKMNNLKASEVEALMKNKSLWNQVKAQLLWNKLLGMLFTNKLKISQEEINTELKKKKFQILEVTLKQVLLNEGDDYKVHKLKSLSINCSNFEAMSSSVGLNENSTHRVKFSEINEQLQHLVSRMSINQISEPVFINNQAVLIMVCDTKTKEIRQNASEVKEDIFERKLSMESAKYLKELKKRVNIEYFN